MNNKLQRIFEQALIVLGPYIILGICVAFVIGLFILSYYVLLWGFIIGFCLWVFALIKPYLVSKKPPVNSKKGRIIDHDKNL